MSVTTNKDALIAKDLIILQPIVKNSREIWHQEKEDLKYIFEKVLEEEVLDEVVDKVNLYKKLMTRQYFQ